MKELEAITMLEVTESKQGRSSDARRRAFGAALLAARQRAGRTQASLGEALDTSQAYVAQWEKGDKVPDNPDRVFEIERALGVTPGSLSGHLGYYPPDGFEAMIQADKRFSAGARDALLACYRAILSTTAGPGRRRRQAI